jgi:serine protease inhibitor
VRRVAFFVFAALLAFARPAPVYAGDDLDFAFLAKLSGETSGENVVISSANLEKALQLLALGAEGPTAVELKTYLHKYPPFDPGRDYRTVQTALCLWVRPDWAFLDSFEKQASALHGAAKLMQGGDAASSINGCVAEATKGQITRAILPGAYASVGS